MELSKSEVGAISELKACVWLLGLGYEVYRNVTPNGKFDIVAIKGKEIIKIDVTTTVKGRNPNNKKQQKANQNGGVIVYVYPDGMCKWEHEHQLKLNKYQCIICSTEFETFEKHRKTCGSETCLKANANRHYREHEKRKKEKKWANLF